VAELVATWLETQKPAPVEFDIETQTGRTPTKGLRMQTWIKYHGNARDHILPRLGHYTVAGIGTPDCEAALHAIYDKKAGTGYRTADLAKQLLQQIMDYAVRQGHRPDNPVRSVSRIHSLRHDKKQVVSPELAFSVHAAALGSTPEPGVGGPRPTSRLADIVMLLSGTGLRIGEVLAVRWQDLDLAAPSPTLKVTGTLVEQKGLFFRQDLPKNRASVRTIHLPEWAAEMLLRRRMNATLTSTDAVFHTRNGTFVTPSNFRTELKKAMAKGGVSEPITPHAFRRTVATTVAENVSDEAAAAQLGHASVEVTRAHYIVRSRVVPDYSEFLKNMASGSWKDE
jgi:integrase